MKPLQPLIRTITHQSQTLARTTIRSSLTVMLACWVPAHAESSYPYSCEWTSEVATEAVIRFYRTNGIGTYMGDLLYNGKKIMGFQEGISQGYAMNWWSNSAGNTNPEPIIVFNGNQPTRAAAELGENTPTRGARRVLIAGLGRHLYYSNPQWRNEGRLSAAAEGFWKIGKDCHAF